MRKVVALLVAVMLCLLAVQPVLAQEGKVTYDGNARAFIFEPGSENSPTDLFPNFKDVMPGDTLTQKITVQNDAAYNVKVKIYMRALGAHTDSVAFLSQLGLKVQKSKDNEMAYMFDAAANETAQLTDWVCLGTLYSGGQVDLDVILDVPVEMDNEFQSKIGYLDWEFMIEEFPIEDTDPKPPQTGDNTKIGLYAAIMTSSVLLFLLLVWCRKKKRQE